MSKGILFCSFLLLIFTYLWFSYSGFYDQIGKSNLKSPYENNTLVVNNSAGEGLVKYAALGDSLTAGVGSNKIEETLVYQYAKKLSESYQQVEVLNLGKPGATTSGLILSQLPQAISAQPDYITLLIGVNDIHNKVALDTFKQNFKFILTELLGKTNAQITLINIPYLGSGEAVRFPFDLLLNYRTLQFNQVLSEYSNSGRVMIIDLYSKSLNLAKENPGYYSSDQFHPSGQGYLLWGKIINAD